MLRFDGASGVTRTPDLLITNQLLYRLSYTSICSCLPNSSEGKYSIFYRHRQHLFPPDFSQQNSQLLDYKLYF